MKWVEIQGEHINTDQIRTFCWKDGELCAWYAGRHYYTSWPDPERELYFKLCRHLAVSPCKEEGLAP